MSLDSEDWQKINGCLLRLYRELEPERQIQTMLEVVRELVPGDCIALDHFNPVTKQTHTDTLPLNFATQEDVVWIHRYNHQSPIAPYFSSVADPEWKTITDFMPLEDFQQTDFHRLGLSRVNVNHQLLGLLAHAPPLVYILSVNRTNPPITQRERTLLNTIHPHLVTSFLNAQKFSHAVTSLEQLKSTMEVAPGAYGYFTKDRKLSWLQPRAQEWLPAFFTNETRNLHGLPRSILRLVEGATDGPVHLDHANDTHRLTVCVLPSVLGGWILRLERKPVKPVPHFHPLPQLSPRENEVLQWMVEGKRNYEIATIIHLSPRTVEKHVAQIFVKLEVENRASAIVRAMELCAAAQMAVGQ
jgi:DNA-binding CsgD family transcriptional regulator